MSKVKRTWTRIGAFAGITALAAFSELFKKEAHIHV